MSDEIRLALLALLRRIEWSVMNHNELHECPICFMTSSRRGGQHETGCELSAAIQALDHAATDEPGNREKE